MAQVLVIDDDPRVLRYAALLLRFEGHRVRTESTYADGLAAMAEAGVDVVVVDVRLGATSGLELLAAARRGGLAARRAGRAAHERALGRDLCGCRWSRPGGLRPQTGRATVPRARRHPAPQPRRLTTSRFWHSRVAIANRRCLD